MSSSVKIDPKEGEYIKVDPKGFGRKPKPKTVGGMMPSLVGIITAKMLKGVEDMETIVGDASNIGHYDAPVESNEQVIYDHRNWSSVPWISMLLTNINWPLFILIIGCNCLVIYVSILLDFEMANTVHSMSGVALFLLLGFRANSCYERYWDGRKLMGTIMNVSRDLARQISCYCPAEEDRDRVVAFLVAFSVTVKRNLRGEKCLEELKGILHDQDIVNIQMARHMPLFCLDVISHYVNSVYRQGLIDGHVLVTIDNNLSQLELSQGGCERIKSTPVPLAYVAHLRVMCFMWLTFLPLPLIGETEWYALIPCVMIVYAVLGIDAFASELAMPFGNDKNDLPLGMMCEALTVNLREIMIRAKHSKRDEVFEMGTKIAWSKFNSREVGTPNVKLGTVG